MSRQKRVNGGKKGVARLFNKRAQPNYNGHYVVDTVCSLCGYEVTLTFSGWCGIICKECGAELARPPYRKKTDLQQLAEAAEKEGE